MISDDLPAVIVPGSLVAGDIVVSDPDLVCSITGDGTPAAPYRVSCEWSDGILAVGETGTVTLTVDLINNNPSLYGLLYR